MTVKLSSVKAEQELYLSGGVPIDRVAWRVIQKGEHFESRKRITQLLFDAMPPLRGTSRGPDEQRPKDMTGRRVGRMVVVGYWGPKRDKNGKCRGGGANQVWVCRCPCGLFVTRTGKTIQAKRDPDDKCEHCRQLEYLKRHDEYRRLGLNEDQSPYVSHG